MLRADWRGDRRPWLHVDLARWPADLLPDPLPPVPVVAVGGAPHPQTARFDATVTDMRALASLATAIEATPRAAETLTGLLRAAEGLAPEAALTAESLAMATLQGGAEHGRWLAGRTSGTAAPPGQVSAERRLSALHLRLDRPAARNAIDRAMRDALFDAFMLAALDDGIDVIRLTSAGRCFSIGADLAEFGTTRDPAEAHATRARTLPALPLLRRRGRFEAHVRGACIGAGLEIAAFANRLTATPDAWFQLPELRMGILPGFGGCVSVPRRIGRQRAAWLMLSGRRIGARTALAWGLVDALVHEGAVDQRRAHEVGG